MARDPAITSMLEVSLDEYYEAAKFCCEYRKTDLRWNSKHTNGCLGYPAGVLLFSIIDSIGSYLRNNPSIKIIVDGKNTLINSDGWEHFKILNSNYFNQTLSQDFIKALWEEFRCVLTHNAVLGTYATMIPNNDSIISHNFTGKAFFRLKNSYMISLAELLELCKKAIEKFKNDIPKIVPGSDQEKKFLLKNSKKVSSSNNKVDPITQIMNSSGSNNI